MKVYKDDHHSLFVRPFGVHNRLYLGLTVFVFFDLTAPDDPLTEQDLWKAVPDLLKPSPVLDQGMPKTRGEVLVAGSCFSPRGTTRQASTVSVTVGKMGKELAVFGNRYWKRNLSGLSVISDPLPFSEMPVTWENAFGGKDFPQNTAGKGMEPIITGKGDLIVLLPNIELRTRLIGSPSDRPEPAGFGQLDIMAPLRQKKTGTYDDRWLKERWPYLPDDMDYEFFNCAPEDQYMEGFFTGTEMIEIINMNPDIQRVVSRLPNHRVRCFVTKRESPGSAEEIFQDVTTHIDTLWLFPAILRGVVVYRGTTEIYDEEYEDVLRIFIAGENPAEPPGSLEYYLEEQKKAMDLSVPIDMAPLEAASKEIGDMMKRMKKIPKELDTIVKMATGKAPVMPRTPAEVAGSGKKVIEESLALITKLEAQSREFHSDYGHLMKIDLGMFDRMRKKLAENAARVDETLKKVETASESVKKNIGTAVKEGAEKMRKSVPAHILEKAGFAPESLLIMEKHVNPWHDRGFPFVVERRRNLEGDRETMDMLHNLGLDRRSIERAWLGVNGDELKEGKELWGIKPSGNEGDDHLLLPAGLVIPRFDGATLNRILILPPGWEKGGPTTEQYLIEGSDKEPLFILVEEGAPIIRTADELQAALVEQEIGDACSVVVLADTSEKPSKEAAQEMKAQDVFVILLPHTLTAGTKEWESWKKAYPNAILLPFSKGATVFQARKEGIDLRRFIMEVLPEGFRRRHKIAPEIPGPGQFPSAEGLTIPIPHIDVEAIVERSTKEVQAYAEGKVAGVAEKMAALEKEMTGKAADALRKAGRNPDEVLKVGEVGKFPSIAEAGDTMVAKLAEYKAFMKGKKLLTADHESTVDGWMADIKKRASEGQARYDAGMAKLEEAKKAMDEGMKKLEARQMPDEANAVFLKHGMDPDRMVARTREEVIAMHGRGESLAFARLSGVDLSGLDLRGIDLEQAQCADTNFTGSILDGANLAKTMAQGADFTGCSMKDAKIDMTMFIRAKFRGADLKGAIMNQAILKEADLTEADLTGARLDQVVILKTPMARTRFRDTRAHLSIITDSDASDAVFTGAQLERCILRRLTLDRADFSHAAFPYTLFMETKGERILFAGANLHEGRMSNDTRFPGADFHDAVLTMGSFRDTDLSGGNFRRTRFDGALIEKCNLKGADMAGISAKTCRLSKCDLEGADMRYINLFGGSLRKSRLVGADLRGSNLFGVDFYKAIFGETRLEGANVKLSVLAGRTEILKSEKGIS